MDLAAFDFHLPEEKTGRFAIFQRICARAIAWC